MLKNLPVNLLGRDFVCGDIHGSYSCVERFLKEIDFDEKIDRLICAGDLIDRGPENEKCMELLLKPWFHTVKGNHEMLMIDHFADKTGTFWWWVHNGGVWGQRYKTEQSDEALFIRDMVSEVIEKLPLVITVNMADGKKFHVLHAELYHDGPIYDSDIADPEILKRLTQIQTSEGPIVGWGRYIFGAMIRQTLDERAVEKIKRRVVLEKTNRIFNPGLSHIYSGHSVMKRPVQFFGQTCLDTQAYGSYSHYGDTAPEWCGLTVTEPRTGKFWLVNDRKFTEVLPVIIN